MKSMSGSVPKGRAGKELCNTFLQDSEHLSQHCYATTLQVFKLLVLRHAEHWDDYEHATKYFKPMTYITRLLW